MMMMMMMMMINDKSYLEDTNSCNGVIFQRNGDVQTKMSLSIMYHSCFGLSDDQWSDYKLI